MREKNERRGKKRGEKKGEKKEKRKEKKRRGKRKETEKKKKKEKRRKKKEKKRKTKLIFRLTRVAGGWGPWYKFLNQALVPISASNLISFKTFKKWALR